MFHGNGLRDRFNEIYKDYFKQLTIKLFKKLFSNKYKNIKLVNLTLTYYLFIIKVLFGRKKSILMKEKFARAAVFVKQKSDLIVDNIELPLALEVGQVLVKIFVSGICGSQIGEINGVKGKDKFLPHLLGHEGCGEVLEIGPGVKTVNVGDRFVFIEKGIGYNLILLNIKETVLNAGWITTFNNYAVISENRCTKVTDDISNDDVALFGCAVTTGFGVIENNAELRMGESIVVFGSGGLGLNIIQAAKLRSAWPIIAVDLYDNRLKLAKELGAHYCINSNCLNPKHEIEKF